MNRRDFIKAGAAAMITAGVLPTLMQSAWASDSFNRVTLKQCAAMTPQEMATLSPMLRKGMTYLEYAVSQIADPSLRKIGNEYLTSPCPTLLARYTNKSDRERLVKELVTAKFLATDITASQLLPAGSPTDVPQPVLSAPGSGYMSHHSYPGGLVTHLAANVSIAMHIAEVYTKTYAYDVDIDTVILAQLLHDYHKPWVFQWMENGESLPEITIAGTGAHHVLSIAQALYSGFDPSLVVAMACAHAPATSPQEREEIIGWITAAGIIAGVDPVRAGVLGSNGSFPLSNRQEGFITHLGDHDWVLSVPAAKNIIDVLKTIAKEKYKMNQADLNGKAFNSFRNYIASQVSMMRLHHEWSIQGQEGVYNLVSQIVAL